MDTQFSHLLLSSFYLYVDDALVRGGNALETGKSQSFIYSDLDTETPSNMVAYYSSDRQLSPYNATGYVYVNGSGITQNNTVGPLVDFEKGRVLFASGSGINLSVSGNFDRKEVNLYLTPDDEESVLLNKEFNVAGESFLQTITGDGFARYTIPAVFILNQRSEVEPYALGGEKESCHNIRCLIVADSNYLFEGIKGVLEERRDKVFYVYDYEDYPFGQMSAIKNQPYSYTGFCATHTGQYLSHIDRVKTYNLADTISKRIGLPNNIKIGFADFDISTFRGTI